MAEDSFALGVVVGLLIGLFCGIPAGWLMAQALKSKEGSVVSLSRDEQGRIMDIVEKPL